MPGFPTKKLSGPPQTGGKPGATTEKGRSRDEGAMAGESQNPQP